MRIIQGFAAGLAFAVAASGCAQQPRLEAAAEAMGAGQLTSIQFSGNGTQYAFGQAYEPGGRWPRFVAKAYTIAVDYQTPAMRLEMLRAQGEDPPRGGGAQPFATDVRTIQVVSGKSAWTEGGQQPAPNPGAVSDRLRALWVTPHGIIKAAMASGAAADEAGVINLMVEGRAVKATLNAQNMVERVEYQSVNSVVGDYPVEITYSDYAQFGNIMFPRRIVQKEDGFDTLDITVSDVQPNASMSLPVPENVTKVTAPPPLNVQVEKVANGLYSLAAAGTRSLAVEFRDHVVMLEGPTSDARSAAVNEMVRKTIPDKPIRYVVNTHAHYDHAGGLRQYVAEGITVITHESNKPFFEKAWARPRTLESDPLAKSPKPPMIETVADKRMLTDGAQTVELYYHKGNGHHTGTLIAWLPRERILMYGDAYNPPAGDEIRTPERGPEYARQLVDLVEQQLKLNPVRIAPVHGRVVPYQNLKIAFGL
ncbi:MAG: MBL fold metallo-hydrolase [Acidobacteria bacterium]|nr:MBL fold metallo-hydrolase [Acidobacteriota bacterium]